VRVKTATLRPIVVRNCKTTMPSVRIGIHNGANIDQCLVKCLKSDQTSTRVFDIKNDVDQDDRDECKAQYVQPTPVLPDCHSVPGQ